MLLRVLRIKLIIVPGTALFIILVCFYQALPNFCHRSGRLGNRLWYPLLSAVVLVFKKKKNKKKGTISRQLAYGGSGTDRFMSTLVVEVLIDKTRAQKRAIKAISMLAFS